MHNSFEYISTKSNKQKAKHSSVIIMQSKSYPNLAAVHNLTGQADKDKYREACASKNLLYPFILTRFIQGQLSTLPL